MSDTQLEISTGGSEELRGDRIAALMWSERLRSVSALARRMDVNGTVLRRKINGERPWYFHEVVALAAALNTTIGYLSGESDVMRPVNAKVPASSETGTSASVAGTGFEPATSGL
jgi:hypothetical protein